MEHLENDMDDLFRKAGELYPLKITESDWDGVAGKLRNENIGGLHAVPDTNAKGLRNKRKWRFLLILIPLGITSFFYITKIINQQKTDPSLNLVKTSPGGNASDPKIKTDEVAAGGLNSSGEASKTPNQQDVLNKKIAEQSDYTAGESSLSKNDLHVSNGRSQNQSTGVMRPAKNDIPSNNKYNIPTDAGNLSTVNHSVNETSGINPQVFHEPAAKPISLSVYGPNEIVAVYGIPFSLSNSAPVTLNRLPTATAAQSKSNNSRSSKGLYIGFLAGPDLSTVDFQSVKQPGFSLGALVGYRFNNLLSVETGLLWDKKYYYSDGEYFDKSNTHIPPSLKITDLDGNCNMFEIPLALRIDFATRNNHGFFAKAGLSSYLMKKENYSIRYDTAPPYNGTFYNTSNSFFSILAFSGGYEMGIGAKTKIRIEPYVKIPMQGFGIGSMPISSMGFYLGISHSFR